MGVCRAGRSLASVFYFKDPLPTSLRPTTGAAVPKGTGLSPHGPPPRRPAPWARELPTLPPTPITLNSSKPEAASASHSQDRLGTEDAGWTDEGMKEGGKRGRGGVGGRHSLKSLGPPLRPSTILGDLACSFSLFIGLLDRLKSGSGSSEELCIWPRFPARPRWSCTPDPTQKALRLSYWVRQEPKSRAQLDLLPPEVSPG